MHHRHPGRLVGAALALSACASTTALDAQWTDPQFQGRSLRGSRVLVVCEAVEAGVREQCQERLAAQLIAFAATPLIAPVIANPTPGREQPTRAYLDAARAVDAQVVFSAAVTVNTQPTRVAFPRVGIGGVGLGRRGGGVGLGGGVSVSVGGDSYGMSGALTDVASGKLMWSGSADHADASGAGKQLDALSRAVAEGAHRAGFF